MRRIFLFTGLLVFLGAGVASAQVVDLSPTNSDTLACGETFDVDVLIDSGITDLRAFTLYITYDGDKIAPNSSSAGALVSGAACGNIFFPTIVDGGGSPIDTLKVDVGLLGCSVSGAGSILTAQFERVVNGIGIMGTDIDLNPSRTSFRDSGNNPISITIGQNATLWSACDTKPIAVNDSGIGFTTDEDVPFTTASVLDNDIDPDPDVLSVTGFDDTGTLGTVSNNGDGTFDYTPVPETSGSDTFIYYMTDGQLADTATVTITIDPVNDPPVALDDDAVTPEDVMVVIDVLADNGNGVDYDIDNAIDPTSAVVVPASGPSNGSVQNNGDGTFDYTPNLNYDGVDSFRYTVDDVLGGTSNEATVTITMIPMNDPPIAQDDSVTSPEDTDAWILVANDNGFGPDTDPDDGIAPGTVTVVDPPANGSTFSDFSAIRVVYTPDPDFTGTDSFTYYVRDFAGDSSNVATIFMTVTPVNDAPTIDNPGNQTNNELDVVSLQLVTDDVDNDPLQHFATGLPPGLGIDANTGLFSGQIACGDTLGSPYSVEAFVTDGTDTLSVAFSWTVNPASLAPVSSPAAAQQTTLNDASGTTAIMVSWTRDLVPNEVVEVYRKGFGDYPEYDDGAGVAPTQPSSAADALANGWVLAGATTDPSLVDQPSTRDFWYYVAFVTSPCGESGPSAMTGGTLNYHLGDFTDGTALPNPGDNALNFNDVGLFGANYATPVTSSNNVLDIGPTTNGSVSARPTTDNVIGFEDLVLLSINFGAVSAPGIMGEEASFRNAVTMTVPGLPQVGEEFPVALELESDGTMKALRVALRWNQDVVEPVGYEAGDFMARLDGWPLVLSPAPGTVDAAVIGSSLLGKGLLASVTFRVKGLGDPGIGVDQIEARDTANRPVAVIPEEVRGTWGAVPITTRLLPGAPNPFRAGTVVAFDLAREGRVSLNIFGIDGRLVRQLANDHFNPGSYEFQWNGLDERGRGVAAGIYLIRFQSAEMSASRRVVRLN